MLAKTICLELLKFILKKLFVKKKPVRLFKTEHLFGSP